MKDSITAERVKLLHPAVREEVPIIIARIEDNLPFTMVRMVQGLRDPEDQARIYAQGRTTPGKIVTWAKPGQSYHEYGLAGDFALLYDKDKNGTYETLSWDTLKDYDRDGNADWEEMVAVFELYDWDWGGVWAKKPDAPHFEKTFGLNWREMARRRAAGDFIPGTNYIRL